MDWIREVLRVVVSWLDPCRLSTYRALRKRFAPSLADWLTKNRNVADAITWQHQPAHATDAYVPPTSAHKLPWRMWPDARRAELEDAYREMYVWLECRATQMPMDPAGLTDQPVNLHPSVPTDSDSVLMWVSDDYMWRLYVAHVAFSLAAERVGLFPWRIAGYDAMALRYLFDSTTMAWRLASGAYWLGTYLMPVHRADNRPHTAFAPPTWTYPWLKQAGLIGGTTQQTINKVLQWMRQNLSHFYGTANFGTFDAVWQYRGFPPLSKIVNGTVDANNPGEGRRRWTAGCHGSVGFLCAVLRAANIPVQPVWVCGHGLAHFITDNLYLDHGDDPYNQVVKNSATPIDSLLIEEATYQAWFTNDLAVNLPDPSPGCPNVGRRAAEWV